MHASSAPASDLCTGTYCYKQRARVCSRTLTKTPSSLDVTASLTSRSPLPAVPRTPIEALAECSTRRRRRRKIPASPARQRNPSSSSSPRPPRRDGECFRETYGTYAPSCDERQPAREHASSVARQSSISSRGSTRWVEIGARVHSESARARRRARIASERSRARIPHAPWFVRESARGRVCVRARAGVA